MARKKKSKRRLPVRRRATKASSRLSNRLMLVAGVIVVLSLVGAMGGVYLAQPEAAPAKATPLPIAPLPREADDFATAAASNGPITGTHEMASQPVARPTLVLPPGSPQPNIEMPVTTFDFGVIEPTGVVNHAFQVRNSGQTPLIVSQLWTTCPCTTAVLPTRVIRPGDTAEMVVYFDPALHPVVGEVMRGVLIATNDPDEPLKEVTILATVKGPA